MKTKTSHPAIDKSALIKAIVARLTSDLESLVAAARATHAEATHEQNKPENKYDTRALEASYLAHGQTRKVADLENARHAYEALSLLHFPEQGAIDVGACVTLEGAEETSYYLLGPQAGGIEIEQAGVTITVITPQSPLGQQLMGKRRGEAISFQKRSFRIGRVS